VVWEGWGRETPPYPDRDPRTDGNRSRISDAPLTCCSARIKSGPCIRDDPEGSASECQQALDRGSYISGFLVVSVTLNAREEMGHARNCEMGDRFRDMVVRDFHSHT
jgi:hypothetical protein